MEKNKIIINTLPSTVYRLLKILISYSNVFCCIFVSYTNICPGKDGERGEGEEGRQDQGETAEGRADGSVLRPKQERDLQV